MTVPVVVRNELEDVILAPLLLLLVPLPLALLLHAGVYIMQNNIMGWGGCGKRPLAGGCIKNGVKIL